MNTASTLPPGAYPWLYDGREALSTWKAARTKVLALRPQGIILHNEPDASDEAAVRAIQRELPGTPLLIAVGINGLVARVVNGTLVPRAVSEVEDIAGAWAERCASWGVAAIVWNAEGASAAKRPGWKPGQPLNAVALDTLARAIVRAAHEAAPGLPQAYSSHDVPKSHRCPHAAFLSGADYLLPQEYTAPEQPKGNGPPIIAGHDSAWKRAHLGEPQWTDMASRFEIPARFEPGQDGFWPAYQLHHTDAAALVAIAWRYPRSAWWAINNAMDGAGLEACETVAAAHRVGLWQPDVAVMQRAIGATPDDGEIGPTTYRVLREYLELAPGRA